MPLQYYIWDVAYDLACFNKLLKENLKQYWSKIWKVKNIWLLFLIL